MTFSPFDLPRPEVTVADLTKRGDSCVLFARVGEDGKTLDLGTVDLNSGRLALKPGAFVPIRFARLEHEPVAIPASGELTADLEGPPLPGGVGVHFPVEGSPTVQAHSVKVTDALSLRGPMKLGDGT